MSRSWSVSQAGAVALGLAVSLLAARSDRLAGAEPPEAPPQPVVTVQGEGLRAGVLSAADLAGMPRVSVVAEDHGKKARFEGVPLSAVLERFGAPMGEHLRGDKLTLVLVVAAADGYRAVFALPELDPAFTDKVVILADHRDGEALSAHEGPFRVIAAGEKRQARWVRQVISLDLRPAPRSPPE